MSEHHAKELRRALADAADANRAVMALLQGARAVVARVDLAEDFPGGDELDAADRLLELAGNMGRSAGAILLSASSYAAAATEGGAHD